MRAAAAAGREGDLYRIRFHVAGPDPRIALRAAADLTPEERAAIAARLARLDARAATGRGRRRPCARSSARRACARATSPRGSAASGSKFKTDVRKLKALGLTESLAVGYRLSPRGRAYLDG